MLSDDGRDISYPGPTREVIRAIKQHTRTDWMGRRYYCHPDDRTLRRLNTPEAFAALNQIIDQHRSEVPR